MIAQQSARKSGYHGWKVLPLLLLLAREPTHCQTVSLAVEPQRASVPACGSNRMLLNYSVPPFLDHPVLLNPAFSHLPYRLHHCTDWSRWQGDWSCEEGGVTHRFFVLWFHFFVFLTRLLSNELHNSLASLTVRSLAWERQKTYCLLERMQISVIPLASQLRHSLGFVALSLFAP